MKYGEGKYGQSKYGAVKIITAAIKSLASMVRNPLFYRMLTCAVSAAGSVRRRVGKLLSCSIGEHGSIGRHISKAILTSVTASCSLIRTRYKELAISVRVAAGGLKKTVKKVVSPGVKINVAIRRLISKKISGTVKAYGLIRRMLAVHKQLFPGLTVIQYPVELKYTEYPIILEVIGVPKAGSTITLRGEFPDSAGNLSLLADVTVKVYAPGRVLLQTISGANVTEVSVGIYTAGYTIPEDKFGQFDYEFSGVIGNKTIVGRSSFDSLWK